MKKILLIEDNREISDNIKEYLELEGFSVEQSFDGEDGLENSLSNEYDMILLDLMLPKYDGIHLAQKVSSRKEIPILMITARESIDERLLGFSSGAIDYLVKPFDLRELVARMRAHISNTTFSTGSPWGLVLDFEKRVFSLEWKEIHLTQKEFLILEKLYQEQERVVTRSDIIEYLWGENGLFEWGDNKLDVYISNIRSKLGKDIIRTIKGVWYTFGK